MNTTLYFPIGFNTTLTLIGVGFAIASTGRQYVSFTSTSLRTTSNTAYPKSGTNSYFALGI